MLKYKQIKHETEIYAEQLPALPQGTLLTHHHAKNIRLTNHTLAVANPGDWLVKNAEGEVTTVYSDTAFKQNFEAVTISEGTPPSA